MVPRSKRLLGSGTDEVTGPTTSKAVASFTPTLVQDPPPSVLSRLGFMSPIEFWFHASNVESPASITNQYMVPWLRVRLNGELKNTVGLFVPNAPRAAVVQDSSTLPRDPPESLANSTVTEFVPVMYPRATSIPPRVPVADGENCTA